MNSPHPHDDSVDLRPTQYDRVSSWLIASLIVTGFFVTQLFLLWLCTFDRKQEIVFTGPWIDEYLVESENPDRRDAERRRGEEVEVPGIETEAPHQLAETLKAVSEVVSSQAAFLDRQFGPAEESSGRQPGGDGGEGAYTSDGPSVLPPSQRWRLKYRTDSVDSYGRQLDQFGIELAAVGKDGIHYARGFGGQPMTRRASGDGESRPYFAWKSGRLEQFDRQLLQRAGVASSGRQVVQFIPSELEQQLLQLELAAAGGRELTQVRQTIFGVRAKGGNFEFYVITQVYWRQ